MRPDCATAARTESTSATSISTWSPRDLAGDVARAVDVEVGHDDVGALGRKAAHGGRADPRSPAGDERALSLESHRGRTLEDRRQ